jgi:hypothetical protein
MIILSALFHRWQAQNNFVIIYLMKSALYFFSLKLIMMSETLCKIDCEKSFQYCREHLAEKVFELCCDHLNYRRDYDGLPELLKIHYNELKLMTPFRAGLKLWREELANGKSVNNLSFNNRWTTYLKLSPKAQEIAMLFEAVCNFLFVDLKESFYIEAELLDFSRQLLCDYFYLGLEQQDKLVFMSSE